MEYCSALKVSRIGTRRDPVVPLSQTTRTRDKTGSEVIELFRAIGPYIHVKESKTEGRVVVNSTVIDSHIA